LALDEGEDEDEDGAIVDGIGWSWIGRYETRSVDGLMVECRTTYASGCLERLPHLLLTSMYSLLDVVPLP